MMAALTIDDLSLSFGGIHVLREISLAIEPGRITGIIGPNGAGKTSLFNCLMGLYQPQHGQILLDGRSIRDLKVADRAGLGLARTFQRVELSETLTVMENVIAGLVATLDSGWLSAFIALPRARAEMARARELARVTLEALGISEFADSPITALPPGTLRLVEVARALARKPRVLLLDEPAAGLNTTETAELARVLARTVSPDLATVVVEHDMDFISTLCRDVYVLDFGKVIAQGRPEDVLKHPDVVRVYMGEQTNE